MWWKRLVRCPRHLSSLWLSVRQLVDVWSSIVMRCVVFICHWCVRVCARPSSGFRSGTEAAMPCQDGASVVRSDRVKTSWSPREVTTPTRRRCQEGCAGSKRENDDCGLRLRKTTHTARSERISSLGHVASSNCGPRQPAVWVVRGSLEPAPRRTRAPAGGSRPATGAPDGETRPVGCIADRRGSAPREQQQGWCEERRG